MSIPRQAVEIVKKWEGFRAETYMDAVGVPTIGYGTTAAAGVGIVPVPGMTISESLAEKYLVMALEKFAKKISRAIIADMNENEWSAMLSLAYNIGTSAFLRSTVLREFNLGNRMAAADAFLMWNKAGGKVLRGLERRRQEERDLFLTPVSNGFWPVAFRVLKAIFNLGVRLWTRINSRNSARSSWR